MFLDGVTYASIARNLAENYGSFWRPYYTSTIYPAFYEHPPLGLWLQAWAYRLCGDSVYVEALWGFGVGAGILLGLGLLWVSQPSFHQPRAGIWLPMVLCTLFPMTSWIFSNNLLETTMTVFIVAAVYCCQVSLTCTRPVLAPIFGILAGCALACAFLVKGPGALFPLVVPLLWLLHTEKTLGKSVRTCCVMFGTFGVVMLCLLVSESASGDFFKRYLAQQVYASIAGQRETSASHFHVIYAVSREVIVPLLGGGLLTVGLTRSYKAAWSVIASHTLAYRCLGYYLGLALAGSLPLILSAKQKRWYVFPALPFYALALATLFNNAACRLEEYVQRQPAVGRYLTIAALTVLSIAGLVMLLVKDVPYRDKDFHHDFLRQPLQIAAREVISVYPASLHTRWSLVANMQRYFKASLTADVGHTYLLTTVAHLGTENTLLPYRKVHPPFPITYVLLQMDHPQDREKP